MPGLRHQNCIFSVTINPPTSPLVPLATSRDRHGPAPLAAAACRDGGGAPPAAATRTRSARPASPRLGSAPCPRDPQAAGAVTARAETWSRRGHDRCMPGMSLYAATRPPPTPTPLKDIFAPPVGRSRRRQACLCTYINIVYVDAYPCICY